jgi:aspartate racemase
LDGNFLGGNVIVPINLSSLLSKKNKIKMKQSLFVIFSMMLLTNSNMYMRECQMKTIGLLGGTGWSSTIGYYKLLNELVYQRLGGHHSAKIILKSIDYHAIANNYGKDNQKVADLFHQEFLQLCALNPDCIIICCNSLHKFYDIVKPHLYSNIPVFHAVDLVAEYAQKQNFKKVLLLATKLTMEDGFFANILEKNGIQVVIPEQKERDEINNIIFDELIKNIVTDASKKYFAHILAQYPNVDAVILGCTELPLVLNQQNSAFPILPIIDPVRLQCEAGVDFALEKYDDAIKTD